MLHGSDALSIGASPKCHRTVAHPRNAIERSRTTRHRSVGSVVVAPVGTAATAQIATANPAATHPAAGTGMDRVAASAWCTTKSTASQA